MLLWARRIGPVAAGPASSGRSPVQVQLDQEPDNGAEQDLEFASRPCPQLAQNLGPELAASSWLAMAPSPIYSFPVSAPVST